MFGWILFALLTLTGAWFLFFREDKRQVDSRPSGTRKYHCVTIEHKRDACQAAVQFSGVRFLSLEAPTLPLPQCDAVACQCRYCHYDDRRDDERRNPIGMQRDLSDLGSNERRVSGERRRSGESRAATRPQRILVRP